MLTELVEPIEAGETGVLREDGGLYPLPSNSQNGSASPPPYPTPLPTHEEIQKAAEAVEKEKVSSRTSSPDSIRSATGLRQRLQAVVSGAHP